MTAPTGGGRPTTLTPGAGPVLLTEYAPRGGDAGGLLVINTSLTDRAWLASDSNAGPSTGVPLDPGTAIPWTTGGQLWAVADPAAGAPILLIATAAIDEWTPSPAAIAALVAGELLAGGVPLVLVEDVITAGDVLPAFPGTKTYNVSRYAALELFLVGTGNTPVIVDALWRPHGTNALVAEETLWSGTQHTGLMFARLAVIAGDLQLINRSAFTTTVVMSGTNRPPLKRIDVQFRASTGYRAAISGALVANTDTVLVPDDTGVYLSGPAMATFKVTGTATGRFDLVNNDNGRTMTLCDTGEMITNAAGNKYLVRELILPEAGWSWSFHAQTAQAAGTCSVDIIATAG